jgi:hypothetical protein
MKKPAVGDAIRRNTAPAVALHLHEPPAFIGGIKFAGAIALDTLKPMIAEARKQ